MLRKILRRSRLPVVMNFFVFHFSSSASPNDLKFLKSPHWNNFVQLVFHCHQSYPALYTPIEWIRLDLLPENELSQLMTTHSDIYSQLKKQKFSPQSAEEIKKKSCAAAEELKKLIKKTETQLKTNLLGSHKMILETLPEKLRLAITPLDQIFLTSSEMGKKISTDFSQKSLPPSQTIQVDIDTRIITFKSEQPAYRENEALPVAEFYRIKLHDQSESKILIRAFMTTPTNILGKDLLISRDQLSGFLFEATKQSDFPLGVFPSSKQTWVDESGNSHFQGDGHNHKH